MVMGHPSKYSDPVAKHIYARLHRAPTAFETMACRCPWREPCTLHPEFYYNAAIGLHLAGARIAQGLRQKDLPLKTGVSTSQVSVIELGTYSISMRNLIVLARALGWNLGYRLQPKEWSTSHLTTPLPTPDS